MSNSYTYTFGGQTVLSSNNSYALYDVSTASITLSWPTSNQSNPNGVFKWMDIKSTTSGKTITLPDATLTSVGQSFTFVNVGANSISILNNGGGSLVAIASGSAVTFYLNSTTTANGSWGLIPAGGGSIGVISFTSVQPVAGLTVSQNATTGNITQTFALANDLLALENLATFGYATRIGPDQWAVRSFVNGANINITNPQGLVGDTTIALSNSLTNLIGINVGTINLSTNVITTTTTNQDLVLNPNGTGAVNVNKDLNITLGNTIALYNVNGFATSLRTGLASVNQAYTLPLSYPLAVNQVLASDLSGQMSWVNAVTSPGATTTNAIAKYLNTTGQLANTAILIDGSNNITGATSATIQNIAIGTTPGVAGSTTNTICSTNADGSIFLKPNGSGQLGIFASSVIFPTAGDSNGVIFLDGANVNSVALKAQDAAMANDVTYILPNAGPTAANQYLTATTPVANESTMSWAFAPIVQVITNQLTTAVTTTNIMPYGNTAPTTADGDQLITATITPKTAGKLIIEFTASLANTSNVNTMILGLFQDATVNAINASATYAGSSTVTYTLSLRHVLTGAIPGVATTFKIRYGLKDAGIFYMLTGNAAAVTYGNIPQMSLTITEVAP